MKMPAAPSLARRFVADFTSHNRSVYASPPLAARATVLLGHSATLHSHAKPPPHFASPGLATQALIRAGKTSYTAGTLCAMPP
jgi:hypothetical protein